MLDRIQKTKKWLDEKQQSIAFLGLQCLCYCQLYFLQAVDSSASGGLLPVLIAVLGTLPFILVQILLYMLAYYCPNIKLPKWLAKSFIYTLLFYLVLPVTIVVTSFWIMFFTFGWFENTWIYNTLLDLFSITLHMLGKLYYFWVT